jgi:hypothetical protein
MGDMKAYILSVCGAAILCAVSGRFLSRIHASAGVGKLVLGFVLLLVVLTPVSSLYFDELQHIRYDVQAEAEQAIKFGENLSQESLAKIIKDRTATYILQKARALQLDITVEVHLSGGSMPVPDRVYITGNAAPYPRRELQNSIEQDLGISKENQIWT